jgi:predicted MFS family arabinose efflux permease
LKCNLFFLGIAYAIILPTAWDYINTFVSEQYAGLAMGLTLSLFALSGAIAGVVFGYLYDKGVSLKRLILFGSGFQIIGNIFYFIGINIYVLLTSRFILGVGMGLVVRD